MRPRSGTFTRKVGEGNVFEHVLISDGAIICRPTLT